MRNPLVIQKLAEFPREEFAGVVRAERPNDANRIGFTSARKGVESRYETFGLAEGLTFRSHEIDLLEA